MGCIAMDRCVLLLRCGLAGGGVVSVCRLKQWLGWCGICMQAEAVAGVVWYLYAG